ncbi:MAG TPA: protein kinase [Kofleriaceae bacterium]|nr:protein kinase [Kofleriaceae bacterium]
MTRFPSGEILLVGLMSADREGNASSEVDETVRERPSQPSQPSQSIDEVTTPRESFFGADPELPHATLSTQTGDGIPDAPRRPTPVGFPIANWDRYELISYIGRGGMGTVYKARDPQLRRFVALKFLTRSEPERARRFIAEARAQARVEHEHVCKVYEVGTAQGIPYIAMQFIDGVTLGHAGEKMTTEDKVHTMRKVADAVHAAHQGGLIHRDLKRANIMVERTDSGKWQPFVLDFGLAREVDADATLAGEVAGTPAYMAPEQARGERADKRTDVWGLGATFYALLTGRPPNQGTTPEAFKSLVTEEVPSIRRVAPQIPSELATIVMKCLEQKPERRYATAAELGNDIRRYIAGEPIAARRRSLMYRASKRLRRSWGLTIALAVAAIAIVAVVALVLNAAHQRRLAEKRVQIAQRFGQEVARLETFMRQAYAAPLHDTRPERKHVLDRMTAIQAEARELGDIATGPAEYAVGRGHLSLHDYKQAKPHLDAALAAGYDPPEARYALGLTLAALYQEGVYDAERVRDSAVRDAKRAELKKTLRDPALAYLRAVGDSAPEAPAYAEALVAFYEGDFATALTKAAAASQAAPWLYEAHKLAGDAFTARSSETSHTGNYAEAAADLERAGEEYAQALAAAPSDAQLLDAECKRRGKKVSLAIAQRQLDQDMVDEAVEPCERARRADPDAVTVMLREAYIIADAADFLASRRGTRPDEAMKRALPLIEAALAKDPRSAEAYYVRSVLYAALSQAQADAREHPEQSTDQAIAALHKVTELDPSYADAYSDLAFILQQRAEREREAGHDPRPILDEAVAYAERGIATSRQSSTLKTDLGTVWHARADYEAEHGIDPQASLGHAIDAFEASLAINPKNATALNNIGLAFHTRAYYRFEHGQVEGEADIMRAKEAYDRVLALGGTDSKVLNNIGYLTIDRATYLARIGRDPRPVIEEGNSYLERALAANPAERFSYFNMAGLRLIEAEYLVENGKDPAPALAKLETAIDADLERSGTPDPDIIAYRADGHVLAARWAISQKASPADAFAAADTAMKKAEQLDAMTGFVIDARIGLARWRAAWLVSQGQDASATLTRAKAAASQAVEMVHDAPAAHLYVGEIATIEARSLKNAHGADAEKRRAAAIATAKRELEAAVAGNKFYERKVTPLLTELAALASP